MNLIIDIGNTRAKVVVFDGNEPVAEMVTDHKLVGLSRFVRQHKPERGIVSTTAKLGRMAEQRLSALPCPILRMTGEMPVPIQVRYATPETLGADRLAAVVGAWTMYPGNNILVIDAGTCVTYDLVDAQGNYWGGNISPGLRMRLTAMHRLTGRLPQVELQGETPEVGFSTPTAMRSGTVWGLRREIEGQIDHFGHKYSHLLVFLTGGDAKYLDMSAKNSIFAPENVKVVADEQLVPRGLNTILEHNK